MTTFTGWAIDRDYLAADEQSSRIGFGQRDAASTSFIERWIDEANMLWGRRIGVETDLRAADVADPVRFRVLDDDGELCYGGSISRAWLDGEEHLAFAPLQFATADAGATELQYRTENNEWKGL